MRDVRSCYGSPTVEIKQVVGSIDFVVLWQDMLAETLSQRFTSYGMISGKMYTTPCFLICMEN